MRVELADKVIEKLATSDRITIVIERQADGKMRITSSSWDGEKVFSRDQVLEVRFASSDGRLHIARKSKRHDDWDPPAVPYAIRMALVLSVTPSMSSMAADSVIDNAFDVIDGCR
jgi:hypothetical protein